MKEKLLYILSEKQGEYISGQELADPAFREPGRHLEGNRNAQKRRYSDRSVNKPGVYALFLCGCAFIGVDPEKARQSCGADKNKNLPRGWFHQHRGKRGGKTRRAGGLCCHIGKADRRLRQTGKAILFPPPSPDFT